MFVCLCVCVFISCYIVKIVSLLRRISFIADPTYVGKLLDDTILNQ